MFTRSRMMQAAGAGGVVEIALTISGDTTNYNVYSNRGSSYEAGNSIITLTVNSGIYLGSTSTGTAGLIIPSDFHADDQVFIINNGYIVGMGGAGGTGANRSGGAGGAGSAGGPAILASRAVTITNNGIVGGGGGGGGGSASKIYCASAGYCGCTSYGFYRGHGGGGGQGLNGGAGGGTSGAYQNGAGNAGSAGSKTGAGAGGAYGSSLGISGASGGTLGNAGAAGPSPSSSVGGGAGAGGAAGNYANGNSNITWATTGTRLGGYSP